MANISNWTLIQYSLYMQKQRIKWLDNARGICVFFVLMAHCGVSPELYSQFFTPFFLMLFFFISGYLYNYIDLKTSLKKILKTLIIPYFILNGIILFIGIDNWQALFKADWNFLLSKILSTIEGYNLWFVSCLIMVQLFYVLLSPLFCKYYKSKLFVALLLLPTVYLIRNKDSFVMPWCIDIAIFALSYFILGNYFRSILDKYTIKKNSNSNIIALAVLLVYFVISIMMQSNLSMEFHVAYNYYDAPMYFILLSFIGIFTMIIFSQSFSFRFFELLGLNSLVVFAFNGKALVLAESLFYSFSSLKSNLYIYSILLCIAQAVLLLIMAYFINRYTPFIIGKNKK